MLMTLILVEVGGVLVIDTCVVMVVGDIIAVDGHVVVCLRCMLMTRLMLLLVYVLWC